ncbi:MAG: phosphatase PAP2 family protein [Bryobacteraceae bacterium]
MPQVLAERVWAAWTRATGLVWRPVDSLFAGYLTLTLLLVLWAHGRLPSAGLLALWHIAGVAGIVVLARSEAWRQKGTMRVIRHWYPLLYIAACYREMALLIPAIRRAEYDAVMARVELALWGTYPTVWLERLYHPWLTELLQVTYTLFFAAIVLVGGLLWRRHRSEEFRYYAFVVSLGFLLSFLGYFLVPVRGPRFLLAGLHRAPLQGVWLFAPLRHGLDWLESVHYDCFPSGHVALTLIAWWGANRLSPAWGRLYAFYTAVVVFSTVYLRYHYTVDLPAGALLAALVLWIAPRLYGRPQRDT